MTILVKAVSPPFSELLPYLLAIAVLALVMVYVMVQWSRAMIFSRSSQQELSPAPTEGWSPAWAWGFAYAAVWALLIAAYLRLFDRLGEPRNPRNFALLFLVAAGWFGVNWLLILFIRAIQRANEPAAAGVELGRDLRDDWASGDDKDEQVGVEVAAPAWVLGSRLRGGLRTALSVIVFLTIIGIGEALPPLQRLHAWTQAHQQPLLWVTIPVLAIGFVLFMGCAIHLVLTGGRPMSRQEIDRMNRPGRFGPALWRGSVYRSAGLAAGSEGEDSASFSEVKQAWRERAWRASPRWRRLFLWTVGAALLASGLIGTIFVIASAGIKLVLGGAYLYAVVRTIVAFSRA
jgi:hypothetical protein